jgi:RND family efflux transporter MFP subunit
MKSPLSPLPLAGALGVVLVLAGCGHKQPQAAPEPALPAAAVRVQPVASLTRTATEEVVGTVRPRLSASISAKLSGTVAQMLVSPGQTVKAGQVLVEIDAREIQARLDQAQAIREQAQKDLDRFKTLLAQNALTQQEFDAAQSRFRVAEASVAEARAMLGYTRMVAPFDGLVTAKRADVGDLAAPGKPLLDLEDPATLRLEADVPAALFDRIKSGRKLAVQIPAAALSLEAAVSEIAPAADPLSRTFRVKLDLPAAPGLRSGQFGRLAVPVGEVKAMRVPTEAVVLRGQMEIAFVVAQGRASLRLVKTGRRLGPEIEVVSGLNVGEELVVDGAARLRDGQPVEVRSK